LIHSIPFRRRIRKQLCEALDGILSRRLSGGSRLNAWREDTSRIGSDATPRWKGQQGACILEKSWEGSRSGQPR
jgi:hypothetical protein